MYILPELERTRTDEALLRRLSKLKLISQTGKVSRHIDLAACTRHGVAVAEGKGSPYAPAELTWGLVLAAMRYIPHEVARHKAGSWQSTLGTDVRLVSTVTARSVRWWPGTAGRLA